LTGERDSSYWTVFARSVIGSAAIAFSTSTNPAHAPPVAVRFDEHVPLVRVVVAQHRATGSQRGSGVA